MRSFRVLLVVGLAALMMFGVVPAASAATVTATYDNIIYSADPANVPAGATVVGFDTLPGGPAVVILPAVILNGTSYDVTTIGDGAFDSRGLTSVIIPKNVTTIGNDAFSFNALPLVTIPNSVTTIGASAFWGNHLTSVTIPNSVTTIGNSAFWGNALTSVIIPNKVTTISLGAFENNHLTSVIIPNSVTTIGIVAFSDNNLTSVIIPSSVTTIGDYAFTNNPLTSAQFLGAAPSMGSLSLGSGNGLLVSFFARYGPPTVIGGFTTPHWTTDLYPTQALVSVSYSNNGGDGLAPPDSQPPVGSTFSAPADPSWVGHTFTGWFTAASGGSAWNFGTDTVSTDITLYAQWSIIPTLAATGTDMTQQSRITGGAATMLLLGIAAIIISNRRRKGNR